MTKSSKERSDELGEATGIIRNILYYSYPSGSAFFIDFIDTMKETISDNIGMQKAFFKCNRQLEFIRVCFLDIEQSGIEQYFRMTLESNLISEPWWSLLSLLPYIPIQTARYFYILAASKPQPAKTVSHFALSKLVLDKAIY